LVGLLSPPISLIIVLFFTYPSGNGADNASGNRGQATSASIPSPLSVCSDTTGTLYINNSYYTVQKVDSTGIISKFAGIGTGGSTGDKGQATSASIRKVYNCVFDTSSNVYLNTMDDFTIRVVTVSTKIITRYAGSGAYSYGSKGTGDGGTAISATIYPMSIYMDSSSNLYVGEAQAYRVRKMDAITRIITNFAGSGSGNMAGMGGFATSAIIPGSYPFVAGDSSGNLFISAVDKLFRVDGSTNLINFYAG
jgi:hypothetical protein